MDFQTILKQVAAENNTTPEEVYHQMQAALKEAYRRKDGTQGSRALWAEMGFGEECPTPERFVKESVRKLRGDLGIAKQRRRP